MIATTMRVPYSYLDREFSDLDPYLEGIRRLAQSGDFTLGRAVTEFEGRVVAFTNLPHAVGMSNGTDALALSLRALGIGHGDSVIVPANTFVATAGAVAQVGATPIFCDVTDDYTLDPDAMDRLIYYRPTDAPFNIKAVMPVHLTGQIADMPRIMGIADPYGISVIEDAAQAMGATLDGKHAGSWGAAAGISLHPLKMLNVWGDGGLTVTRYADLDRQIRLLRNHGLQTRDNAVCFGVNARLSSLQAVIANRVIQTLPWAIARRREIAATLTSVLAVIDGVLPPITRPGVEPVWMTYMVRVQDGRRDALRDHLIARGVDVKVHYPVPLHLQTVGRQLGYRRGDCPVAERHADEILTLPLHEFLTDPEVEYMADAVREFFR